MKLAGKSLTGRYSKKCREQRIPDPGEIPEPGEHLAVGGRGQTAPLPRHTVSPRTGGSKRRAGVRSGENRGKRGPRPMAGVLRAVSVSLWLGLPRRGYVQWSDALYVSLKKGACPCL